MTPFWSQLLLALLFVTIGFIGGVVVSFLWLEKERQAKPEEKESLFVGKENGKRISIPSKITEKAEASIKTEPRGEKRIEKPLKNTLEQIIVGPPKPAVPVSIVTQVDEILQEMISQAGLGGRGIRLKEDNRLGVLVWIGLDKYVGIDSVPDQEVRSIIRAAVAEWEKREEKK